MKWEHIRPRRILGLDLSYRSFGFAYLDDDPIRLVDFGIKLYSPDPALRLARILKLIDFYEPDLIVIDDWRTARTTHRESYRRLMIALEAELLDRDLPYTMYAQARVRQLFLPIGAKTKSDVAKALSIRFPELMWRVPPIRKRWLPEDDQMGIFDAIALVLTHLDETARRRSSRGP